MTRRKFVRTRILAVITILMATVFAFVGSKPQVATAEITSETIERVWPGVVRLNGVVQVKQGNRTSWEPLYTCSGTIISSDGFILTNHHCTDVEDTVRQVAPDLRNPKTAILVSLTKRDDEPPVPAFFAEVRAQSPYDGGLDIAVLQITTDLNGKPVDGSTLRLPTVSIGDSDALKLGNRIHLFGYQGIGGDTITFTSGDVSGFSFKQGVEGRAWIKHTATAAGGNSGGTAVNEAGELIGIPTQMGYGDAENFADCRRLADTNGDGVIDENDSCIPGGGFINAIRPVNLAKPFIRQAMEGIAPPVDPTDPDVTPTATPRPDTTPTPGVGDAEVVRTFFASGVDDDDQPTTIVRSLPTGSTDLIFFFDYTGFEEGVNFQPRLFLDDTEIEDVWPEEPWQGYTSGQSWIGFLEAELPDGTYKFQLDYNDETLATNEITIGGDAQDEPTVSDIVFTGGEGTESEGSHLIFGDTTEINATFTFANMEDDQEWEAVWLQQDNETGEWTELDSTTGTYGGPGDDEGTAQVTSDTPFPTGMYRLDLNFGQDLAGTGMVVVLAESDGPGPNPNGESNIGPIAFASELDDEGLPVDEGTEFESGIERLYGVFDYAGLQDGMTFNITWLIDGEEASNQDFDWNLGEEGSANVYIYGSPDPSPLPDGTYELRLSVEGQEMQRGSATIGDGTAPDPDPTPDPGPNSTDGVVVMGTIVDATSGRPIEGAAFGVLKEGVTLDDFDGSDEQILDAVTTDQNGEFMLTVALEPGTAYTVLAVAEGYRAFGQDDVVFSDVAETVEITLEMQRR
ncbi:MAG: trypsin-like peptidase domain-containing protein [Chloroflexota bacterium]|nr:trypsin-like peptidase domain-containing protein [Chloroflexota bacterium]MDQ5866755.1 trypsin-like peptidase domain-containing protein [Chloroflexota bacterium]